MLSLLKTRNETSSSGRHASVSADSSGLVMNIRIRPKMATTVERRAIEMDVVPALFINRVSCNGRPTRVVIAILQAELFYKYVQTKHNVTYLATTSQAR